MKKPSSTLQEKFWKSSFGSNYISRHSKSKWVKNNIFFFKTCFKKIKLNKIKSILEFGSNIGLNLMALNKLLKLKKIKAIEINEIAYNNLKKLQFVQAENVSALDYKSKEKYDLVLSKGFLIHVNPNKLKIVYKNLFNSCKLNGYILVAEYYNPTPVTVNYRGNKNVLFKRDFAGEMIKTFKKRIKLIDYGFIYHKDKHPQGDITWFLLQKK